MRKVMKILSDNDPRVVGFKQYKETDDYSNAAYWAAYKEHVTGSLWNAFCFGYDLAKAKITKLQERGENQSHGKTE
jgi:hypothetical protein